MSLFLYLRVAPYLIFGGDNMETLRAVWDMIVSFFSYNVVEIIKTIIWKDVLDILILSVILYGIYCFIRDRRAFKLILGLCFILLLAVLSDFFNLKFSETSNSLALLPYLSFSSPSFARLLKRWEEHLFPVSGPLPPIQELWLCLTRR